MRSRTCAEHHIRQSFTRFSPSDPFSAEQVGGFLATATPFHTWRHQLITRTTRTPAFWGYPRRLMITHTIESYWIPSQKMTKSKLQILKISNFLILKRALHTTHLLKLLDKMCKYEMDPMRIVEDTERTRFCPQMDRRTRWYQYTPLSTSLKRGV